jgi:hypothetical protein
MDLHELYEQLQEAYTEKNLNFITGKVVEAYRNKNYDEIRCMMDKIRDFVSVSDKKIHKSFSKLILLYQPDKYEYYKREIERIYKEKDFNELFRHSHILFMLEECNEMELEDIYDFEEICAEDIHYGYNEEDFDDFSEKTMDDLICDDLFFSDERKNIPINSFLSAIKRKEYGLLDIDFDYYHLKDIAGELELSNYEIEDLKGIERCKGLTSLDLSNNLIDDIQYLYNMRNIEELYLSNNRIQNLDALEKMTILKTLDLSDNEITDVSPLFELKNLQYVNLMGNTIPKTQITRLELMDIVVVY